MSRKVVQMPPALNLEHANLNIFVEEHVSQTSFAGHASFSTSTHSVVPMILFKFDVHES